jgi:cytosine/adenosine deaminase-related metal-dependent hydrolase
MDLLRMATHGSAAALTLTTVGTLTPGKQADYIVIDMPPCPDPIFLHDSIIRNTRVANVRVVAIAGDILKNL